MNCLIFECGTNKREELSEFCLNSRNQLYKSNLNNGNYVLTETVSHLPRKVLIYVIEIFYNKAKMAANS